ncbi:hypothetical protein GS682_31575 [Nostoc sp. B(2019)]|nr:hypothetical protein [Nostoc sp. B(2019)]
MNQPWVLRGEGGSNASALPARNITRLELMSRFQYCDRFLFLKETNLLSPHNS